MHLKDLIRNLPGTEAPAFRFFPYRDVNPLGGTVKVRTIGAPNKAMRVVHARLIKVIRGLNVPMEHAIGGRPHGSPLVNIRRHRHIRRDHGRAVYAANRYFYLLDLSDAYGHVDVWALARILGQAWPEVEGREEEVRKWLLKHCFMSGSNFRVAATHQQELLAHHRPRRGSSGLVQGGPASPDLFNLYAAALLDEYLGDIARQYGLTYTRYIDDLTFSSREAPIGERKRQAIRRVIMNAGFPISDRKAQLVDLVRGPVTMNGVCMDHSGRIFLPRWYLRKLRGLLHAASRDLIINPATVHGMMGVFLGLLPRVHGRGVIGQNRTEQRVLELYAEYRAVLRGR